MIKLLSSYKPLFNPHPDWRYAILTGGRGSGKSWHVALFLLNLTYTPGHIILFTRYTMVAAHISIIPEFIDKIALLNKNDDFEITRTEIINTKTGSRILFRGIKTSSGNQTANLKSIQGVTTWVIDEAEELVDINTFNAIDLSIRSTLHPNRVIMVMNPAYKSHFIYAEFINVQRPDTLHIHTTYQTNKANLSASFIDQAHRTKEANPARYRHLFLGEWLEDSEGIFWTRSMIERIRVEQAPEAKRIIVAIDPATTKTQESDETGIVVVAEANANYYVLEDLSGKYTPNEWAGLAANAVRRWDADCIVAEKNAGGDMVEAVLRQHDKSTRVKLVTATKGKAVRAEPIFALYEQGKVWHVGNHPMLEVQMITFNPDINTTSPDRVDALVWGLTELSTKAKRDFFVV